LSATDFSIGEKYDFSHWFNRDLAAAHHLLGDFEAELVVAKRTRETSPGEISIRATEVRALAALGNFGELERALGEALTLPSDDSGNGGSLLAEAALELRAHGHQEAAIAAARRAVAWWREVSVEASSAGSRKAIGRALYLAEEWDAAAAVFHELSRSDPADVEAKGYAATIAARQGNRALASRYSEELRAIERSTLFGTHTLWRARIAAQLGESERAVDLLRDAVAQGVRYGLWIHRDMDLEPLRGLETFEDLIRPKG
jgi:tetratricopeptide (TPR) repeat protein